MTDKKVFVKYLKKDEKYDPDHEDPRVQKEIEKIVHDYLEKDADEKDQESDSKYILPIIKTYEELTP